MRGTFGILITTILVAAHVVHAQTTTSLRDVTGFGPCSQCRLLGNSEELVPCSQMWRDLLETCSSPQCSSSMSSLQSAVFNIRDCTATPPPLPGGTAIYDWPGSNTLGSGTIIIIATTATAGGTSSTTTASSTTTTATTATVSSATTSHSDRTINSSTTSSTTETTTTSSASTTSSSVVTVPTGNAAATGSVPRWIEGLVFLAGWIFTL